MSGYSGPNSVKLCLNQKDEIFIEAKLHQHQIDGIRFLYRQFQKDKPGVLLNGPSNSGNVLLVAQFVGAIRNANAVLERPVLIVCDEEKKYEWLEHFQNLSQFNNVVLMASHPFVKKTVFIHTMDNIEAFLARDWSVLVVDNDAILTEKTLLARFRADYKIWITSLNLKENLKTFEIIYKWICPKEKLKIDDYKSKGDPKDDLEKTILIETILEDVLFKTNCGITDVKTTSLPTTYAESLPKVSKKNKDATGTKIKRSKRLVEEITLSNNKGNTANNPDVSASKIAKVDSCDTSTVNVNLIGDGETSREGNNSNMEVDSDISDIETFIRSRKPIKFNDFYDEDHDFDAKSNYSAESIHNSTEKKENTAIFENVHMIKNPEIFARESPPLPVTASTDSDDDAYDLDTQVIINDNISDEINDDSIHDKMHENVNEGTIIIYNNQEIENCHVIEEPAKKTLTYQEKSNGNTTHDVPTKEDKLLKVTDSTNANKFKDNDIKNNVKTEDKQNAKNHRLDLDSKITEHEDKIFKKFKGTFLDSIF